MDDFFIEKKVYYHDTDSGGVVYYANYLKFMEEARIEFCLFRGVDILGWLKKNISFVVARVELDYKSPAEYGDTLKISARVERIGNSSVSFIQEIKAGERILVNGRVIWVCVGKDFKSQSLPQEIIAAFK